MARKEYLVTLLKGFSFTTAAGRTFYQNRSIRAPLEELEVARMRSMENGSKFQILDVLKGAAAASVAKKAAKETSTETSTETKRTPVTEDDPDVTVDLSHFEAMTVGELKELLDEIGVEYPSGARKADLVKLAAETE